MCYFITSTVAKYFCVTVNNTVASQKVTAGLTESYNIKFEMVP